MKEIIEKVQYFIEKNKIAFIADAYFVEFDSIYENYIVSEIYTGCILPFDDIQKAIKFVEKKLGRKIELSEIDCHAKGCN